MEAKIQTRTRPADGLEVRYAEWKSGAEPTVLLLSPWPESIYAWEQLAPRIASVARVVAIDLPGFGHSEARAELFSPQAMGGFLVTLVKEWGLTAPHVIGPDVGGPAALFAVAQSPESFTSVIVGNGATSYPLEVDGFLADVIANPDPDSLLALDGSEVVIGSLALHENFEISDSAREDYTTAYTGTRFGESAQFVRNYPTDLAVLKDLLADIKTPVKILASDHDPMVPVSNAHYLDERLANSELTVLDAGHFAWEDRAEVYGDAVLDWLQPGFKHAGGTS
jgi:pimeloyl-ACP methyl ester carboxylesterase